MAESLPLRLSVVLLATVFAAATFTGCTSVFYDHGQNGEWGKEFLSSSKYSKLLIEIDYETGAQPEPTTVTRLKNVAETYLSKPGGIEVRQSADVNGGGPGHKYSFQDIRDEYEDAARDHYKGGDQAVFYVMFLNGGSEADSGEARVLGAAYSGSSVVMFKDNIRNARSNCLSLLGIGCPSVATIEEAVMVHELGHILGLVNNGIPMVTPHEDEAHPGHSRHSDSVMFWKVETGNIIDFFRNGNKIPNTFDEHDKADMRAAGGK